jgi:hypothetical protein
MKSVLPSLCQVAPLPCCRRFPRALSMQTLQGNGRTRRDPGFPWCDGGPRGRGLFIITGTFTPAAVKEATRDGKYRMTASFVDNFCARG